MLDPDLINHFNGQTMSANLFGQEDQIKLPDFSVATISREMHPGTFLVSGDDDTWLVFVGNSYVNMEQMAEIQSFAKRYPDSSLWVIGVTCPYTYPNIFLTPQENLQTISNILISSD